MYGSAARVIRRVAAVQLRATRHATADAEGGAGAFFGPRGSWALLHLPPTRRRFYALAYLSLVRRGVLRRHQRLAAADSAHKACGSVAGQRARRLQFLVPSLRGDTRAHGMA